MKFLSDMDMLRLEVNRRAKIMSSFFGMPAKKRCFARQKKMPKQAQGLDLSTFMLQTNLE
jgi:hypothetical protein